MRPFYEPQRGWVKAGGAGVNAWNQSAAFTTSRSKIRIISTTMGLKSKPPNAGKLLRMGPSMGSVIWNTNW